MAIPLESSLDCQSTARILNLPAPSGVSEPARLSDLASVKRTETQTSHGFAVKDVLYNNAGTWAKARADAAGTAGVVGIVTAVTTNTFELTTHGYVSGLSGLTANTLHYLSTSTGGALQTTEPTSSGHISKPLLWATSTTAGYFINHRGIAVSSPALTMITSATASSSATVDFTTASIFDGTYKAIKVFVCNLAPVNNTVALMMRISQSGSWKSDGTYHVIGDCAGSVANAATVSGTTASTYMGLTSAYPVYSGYYSLLGNASTIDAVYEYTFGGNYGTSGKTRLFRCHASHRHYNNGITIQHWTGSYFANTNAIDGIRFLFESGNISTGNFYVYGIA